MSAVQIFKLIIDAYLFKHPGCSREQVRRLWPSAVKMDFRCGEIGRKEARTHPTAKGSIRYKTRKGRCCSFASDHVEYCHTDASLLIVSVPGSVTLAAAPALLHANNRDTVFPTPARGVVMFIPAGRRGTRSRRCPEPSIVQAVPLAITVLKWLRAFSRFWRSNIIVFPRKCWVILTYWPLLIRSVHVILFSPSGWSGGCAFELITCHSNKVCNHSGLFQRSMLRTSITLL